MASNPPAFNTCCTGVKNNGSSNGAIVKLADSLQAYVTGDVSLAAQKVLIILPDVFGITFINTQRVADSYAENGFYTVVVDLFQGDPVEFGNVTPDLFKEWKLKHDDANVESAISTAHSVVLENYKPASIMAIGYCFGARYIIRLAGQKEKLTACAIAHPSNVDLDDVSKVSSPVFIAAAENDSSYTSELRFQTENVLKEIGCDYFTTLASGAKHGFAVRADPSDRRAMIAKEKAFQDSLWWFSRYSS